MKVVERILYRKESQNSSISFLNVSIFVHSSMTVNLISVGCGLNKIFENKHLWLWEAD